LSNNKHSLNLNFKHSQTILASRPVVVLVHKILNPNFPQISIFCHKCFCQHFILDQMIKCLPKSDLIKAFNFHHFRIQRINIKLIFVDALNCKCYISNLFRQLFNTIIFIHAISLSMLPLLCTRGRCLFSLTSFFIFPFIFN